MLDRPAPGEGKNRRHLDQATVRALPRPTKDQGSVLYLDDEVPGFCCQVSYGGTKTFRLRYRRQDAGAVRPKWFSVAIGEFQDDNRAKAMPGKASRRKVGVTALQARERAVELRNAINGGAHPALELRAQRAEVEAKAAQGVSVREAFQRYLTSIQSRRSPMRATSVVKVAGSFKLHILPMLGDRPMASLTKADIQAVAAAAARPRQRKGRQVGGSVAANRAVAHLSAFLTWCTKQVPPLIAVNVARMIDRSEVLADEHARERYLTTEEWNALMRELDDRPYWATRGSRFAPTRTVRLERPNLRTLVSCEAIRLSLLTGARKGEVYRMRWQDINLDARLWSKPRSTTKTNINHKVALPARAVESLRLLRESHADPLWVFPGKARLDKLARGERPKADEGSHVLDVHELWGQIRDKLGMKDVRQHDLRHTAASILISNGANLFEVGAQLGHSQYQTTMRYAHLQDEAKHRMASIMDAFAIAANPDSREKAV